MRLKRARVGARARRLGVVAIALLALVTGSASALSLADLNGSSQSVISADGLLTFENFDITIPASVGGQTNALTNLDLSIFVVDVTGGAIGISVLDINGPVSALFGQIGSMQISFDVVATAGFRITGIGLDFVAAAAGTGASASVTETVDTQQGPVDLFVVRTGAGQDIASASVSFAGGETNLRVVKDILVDTSAPGGLLAQISEIEQSFAVSAIPEPTGGILFAAGAAVLAGFVRTRRQRDA